MATRSVLEPAAQKKVDAACAELANRLKLDEAAQKQLARFASKWARWKLGTRGTGPHAHGFDRSQRAAITEALRTVLGLPAPAPRGRRAAAPAPAPAAAPPKRAGRPRKAKAKAPSTAELARQQTERAAGTGAGK
jgi:hypothetical protein